MFEDNKTKSLADLMLETQEKIYKEENNTLTDEDVENISKALEEDTPENIKILREIQKGNVPEALKKDDDTTTYMSIDPETGNLNPTTSFNPEKDYSDAMWDQMKEELSDVEAMEFEDEQVAKAISSLNYDDDKEYDPKDIKVIMDIIKSRENGNKVKYADLPTHFQTKIMQTIMDLGVEKNAPYLSNKELKNQLATSFIDAITNEIINTELNESMTNLGVSINQLVKKELGDIVNNDRAQQHKIMLEQLPAIASKVKDEDPKKAESLMKISDAYHEAFTLEKMYNSYAKGKPKIKKIDLEKIQRLCNDFNGRYKSSSWVIQDVASMITSLNRNLRDSVSGNTIKAFVALFIKYTMNMKPENLWDHTFMYYTIYNIASLDLYKNGVGMKDSEKEFYESLLKNIYKITDLIEERGLV